jgi:hypothetical protein
MNFATRLTTVGALLSLAGCGGSGTDESAKQAQDAKNSAAAEVTADCETCRWSTFLNKQVKVKRVWCTKPTGEVMEKCHLKTDKSKPAREIMVMHDEATDGYRVVIETRESGGEADRAECVNLVQDHDNPRVIEGTCVIYNSDSGPGVHHFRASVVPSEEDPTKPEIKFEFRHGKFSGAPDPVHNGEGHGDNN